MNFKQTVRTRISRNMYGGINDFKQGYQPTADSAEDKRVI